MNAGLEAAVEVAIGSFDLAVALDARPGETIAVIGPNGAGKTTLVRALAGLAPLTSGRVVLDGEVLEDASTGACVPPERRRVGVVFQDNVLFPHLSALDNVAFGLRARGRSRAEARRVAAEWLDRLALGDRAAARPDELSGGQAKRVALARVLATEPALLLLDEPFSPLDVNARRETRRLLVSSLGDVDAPRLLVTHDPVDAAAVADRLIVLEGGRIVQQGSMAEMTATPRSPYVAAFVGTNVLRGRSRGSVVDVGSIEIVTAEAAHGDVYLTIPPRAVVLSSERPTTSARNAWAGIVESVEDQGVIARVRVRGAVDLVAEVTAASVEEMEIHAGSPIWVSVKATEISVTT